MSIAMLLEGFNAEVHPRGWHGRFRVGDRVRVDGTGVKGHMSLVGRVLRPSDAHPDTHVVIAPEGGGPHVLAKVSDVRLETAAEHAQRVAKEEMQRAVGELSAKPVGVGDHVRPQVTDPQAPRPQLARGPTAMGLRGGIPMVKWTSRPGGKVHSFAAAPQGHRVEVVKQNAAAGGPRWLANHTTPRGERRWLAKGDKLADVKAAVEDHFAGTRRARPGVTVPVRESNRLGICELVEAFAAPPETPAQSMAIGARQTAQAQKELSSGAWNASKHPRGRGGKFGYTTGGKRATRSSKATSRTVGVGSRGALVASVQRQLGVKADGVYGQQTRQAVARYQQQHHLTVDGVIGRQTIAALRGHVNPQSIAPGPISSRTATVRTHPLARQRRAKPTAPVRVGGGIVV